MFEIKLIYPSVEERLNFIRGLVRISRADTIITPEEEIFFENAALGLGLERAEVQKIHPALADRTIDVPVKFSTKRQALFFFKEAIQLCYVDKVFSDLERNEVMTLAKELGISSESIDSIEAWVLEGREWISRGEELINFLGGE